MIGKFFYLLSSLILGAHTYSVIYEKDFQNGTNCLGPEDKWSRIEGTDYTNCINDCSYTQNPGVKISLLSSQYSEKGFQLIIPSSKITDPYTIIGMDILYMQPVGNYSFEVSLNDMDSKMINNNKPTTEEQYNTINCYNNFPQLTLTTIHSGISIVNSQLVLKIKKEANQFNINIKKIKIWTNCIANCSICSKNDSCGKCINGFEEKILPSGNKVCEQIAGCTIQDCFSCAKDASTEICMRCYPGFVLDASGLLCNPIGNKVCDSNSYQDSNGNCVNYSSVCEKQDTNSSNTFLPCQQQITANNYKCPAGQKIVLFAYQNFSVYNCECDINDCAVCSNQDNSCQTCNTGYNFDSNSKTCKIVSCPNGQEFNSTYNKCVDSCIQGQFLDTITFKCVNCTDINCQDCLSQNQCTTCKSGYFYDPKDKKCYKICSDNQYLIQSSNTCQNCGINCQQCNSNGCIKCEDNTHQDPLNTNNCGNCFVNNCINCDQINPQKCMTCKTGYHIEIDECIEDCKVQNCRECQLTDSNKCKTCVQGYQVSSNETCKQICDVENCLQCWSSSTQVCQQCKPNYQNESGACKLVCNVQNCLQCSSSSMDQCKICDQDYSLDQNSICKCSLNNCLECSTPSSGKCSKCIDGYQLNQQGQCLVICKVNNCQQCVNNDQNKCQQCNQNFNVQNDGQCQLLCLSKNCHQCESGQIARCSICQQGYVLDSNSQCEQQINSTSDITFKVKQKVTEIGYDLNIQFTKEIEVNTQESVENIIKVQIIDATGLTYQTSQVDRKSFEVKINTNNQNFKKRKLKVDITDQQFIQQNKLKQTTLMDDLLPFVVISQEQREKSQKVGSISETTSTVIVSSIIPIAIFGNFYILINTIDITGFFYYTLFLNIRHPQNVVEFYGYFKNFQFPFIPNMFEKIIDPNYSQENPLGQYREQGTDLYFLKSTGQSITIFLLVFQFYALAKIGTFIQIKPIKEYCQKAISKTWELSGLIELYWNIYIYVLVGVLFQFMKYEFTEKNHVLNYILHTAISIPTLLIPFIFFYLVYSKKNLKQDKIFQNKYKFLVSGLKLYDNTQINIKILPEIMSIHNLNILNETQNKKEKEDILCVENVSRLMDKNKDEGKNNDSMNINRNNQSDLERGRVSPQSSEEIIKLNHTLRERHQKQYSKYNNTILFIRKWIFGFLIIFLYHNTQLQLFLISLLHIGMIIYLLYIKPIQKNMENIKSTAGEIVLLAINICDYMLIEDKESEDESNRLKIGWAIIAFSAFILLWHAGQMIFELSKSFLQAIKRLIYYVKSKLQVKPVSLNQTNVQKEEIFSEYGDKRYKFSADIMGDPDINGFQSNIFIVNETNRKLSNELKVGSFSKNSSIIFKGNQNETKIKAKQNDFNNSLYQ